MRRRFCSASPAPRSGSTKLVEAQENYNRIIREGVAPGSPKSWSKAVDDANKEVGAISAAHPLGDHHRARTVQPRGRHRQHARSCTPRSA